jgi:RimJ/RimL family protein N-acetyltransferase
MTAVARAWRGKGLARALKQATIRWAIANGLDALRTGNDVDNAPMRAVNARLGYRPTPDLLTMRGPIAPAKMDAS